MQLRELKKRERPSAARPPHALLPDDREMNLKVAIGWQRNLRKRSGGERIQHVFPNSDFIGSGCSRTHLWPAKAGWTEAGVTKVVFLYPLGKKIRESVHIPHTHPQREKGAGPDLLRGSQKKPCGALSDTQHESGSSRSAPTHCPGPRTLCLCPSAPS